jgi:hypothetical protein
LIPENQPKQRSPPAKKKSAIAKRCCKQQIATLRFPTSVNARLRRYTYFADCLWLCESCNPDFEQFPRSDRCANKPLREDKAIAIKNRFLDIDCAEDYEALRSDPDFSSQELGWVRANLLTPKQRAVCKL